MKIKTYVVLIYKILLILLFHLIQFILRIAGFSVAVGVVFGLMPAVRASRLSPIEALRYE